MYEPYNPRIWGPPGGRPWKEEASEKLILTLDSLESKWAQVPNPISSIFGRRAVPTGQGSAQKAGDWRQVSFLPELSRPSEGLSIFRIKQRK